MRTSDQEPPDGTRGGIGTISRPNPRLGDRSRPEQAASARPVPAAPAPRRTRPGRPGRPGRPAVPPNAQAAPNARAVPNAQAAPQAAGPRTAPVTPHRMPFVLLLCGLLGGALISALVISTTLAAGSFEITRLQNSNSALARQQLALEDQVAQAQSAQTIATEALKIGMRPQGELLFINLKTGKTTSDAAAGWESEINVPGYTP